VRPSIRSYWIARFLATSEELHVEPLRNWEVSREIAGIGAQNQLELRLCDSVLGASINGVEVATLIDARSGIGSVGWRASSYASATKVLLRTFEVRRVA